jgi:hypothetical protein
MTDYENEARGPWPVLKQDVDIKDRRLQIMVGE